jgi:hypothetical protein
MRGRFKSSTCADVKPWVIAAINDEDRQPSTPMWRDAPSNEKMYEERLRRIRFLLKKGDAHPRAKYVADRLLSCGGGQRCCSGACPECGRLIQRWFVRQAKKFAGQSMARSEEELVLVTIVPPKDMIPQDHLCGFKVEHFHRRLKYAMARAGVKIALGGVDFSFDVHSQQAFEPFWCPHFHILATTAKRRNLTKTLRRFVAPGHYTEVPIPVQTKHFDNTKYGVSYTLKTDFYRRTARDGGSPWQTKLRCEERRELYPFLDQIGLADRIVFWGAKPVLKTGKVIIAPIARQPIVLG